ncbi:hypothetical protein BP5796_00341 [Coleophoma crateriformis]|uniref:Trafficking protein particle complex II-specific subunit 65 IgD3 domain-containing protein n=1 Tax=Coleophoma crateriformis TaxID=565419 RepID=A0A3D8T993_9HELO|nr:hypothetical protein BP5796_00341 [Coleophoma crateriformis]
MMELAEIESTPRGSLEFVESSILDTLIPLSTSLDIEDALKGSVERLDEGHDSPLAAIPRRQALFFDETVNVYVILQTPYFDERTLRSYLGRLIITLEAQVVNTVAENYEGAPPSETVYTGSVQDTEDPIIVVQGPNEAGSEGHILVVWKMSAFLGRPRLRLQNPSIVFAASASLKPAEQLEADALKEEYLPSQMPSGLNLLEAFSNELVLGSVKPHLSALRVSRVAPLTQAAKDLRRPLKNMSRRTFRVYPAINARVRYSRPSTTPKTPCVITSLDVDITPYANCTITLTEVNVTMSGGFVEDLNHVQGLSLPIDCRPQDDVTFLYRVEPDGMDLTNRSQLRTLEISVLAVVDLVEGVCQPIISMKWTTSLDFTPPVNPGYGPPTQPIVRQHRPSQLSLGSSFDNIPTVSSFAAGRPDSLLSMEFTTRQERTSSIPDFGVTMTFTGPSAENTIYPGKRFNWSVFVVNRSDRSRKLAIAAIPRRKRMETRVTRPLSTGYGSSQKDVKVADAVLDENIVYAMQRNSILDSAEVVCLSTDIRVGPLAPSACHTVELTFIALKEGIVSFDAVRVVDLGTQEHVDIKDLPNIIVSKDPKAT